MVELTAEESAMSLIQLAVRAVRRLLELFKAVGRNYCQHRLLTCSITYETLKTHAI